MKTNQYYGLRLIKIIYKMLCTLVVITSLGGLGYISLQALNHPEYISPYGRFTWWLPQALGLVIGGGLLALTLYVIAQVIEVQLSVNTKLNDIIKGIDAYEKNSKQLVDEMEKIRFVVQGQVRRSRLQNPSTNPAPQASSSPPTQVIP